MAKQLPVRKNEQHRVYVEDLTHDGNGVAKVDGYTLFIPNALPGEVADVVVTKTNKSYGFARLVRIEKESEARITPTCEHYGTCGGCQLQHMSYDAQLQAKQKQVQDALAKIGGIDDCIVHPTIGMNEPWRYRNKAQTPVGERNGKIIAGFYKKRSHYIIDIDRCYIQHEENDHAIQTVKRIAETYGVKAYDEENHRGILRHVLVRHGRKTNELMVVLITNGRELPNKKKIIAAIKNELPNVKSIVQNINSKRTNVILGEETIVLWGDEYIYDKIGDVTFAISARSFFQVNPEQTEVLYEKALEYAGLTGQETVIDAYCGIGTISLFLAKRAKHVYGVEIVPDAIEDAKRNARLNGIENVDFVVGEAEKVIPAWYDEGVRPDVIVVDPPRKGCDESLLETMIAMKPKRIVYVSCNPSTLARDLRILEEGGFRTVEVQPVDMFPQTTHVECCVLLKKK